MTASSSNRAANGSNYLVISADGHDGPPEHPEKLLDYMSAKHRDAFSDWLSAGGPMFADLFADKDSPYQNFFEKWAGMDPEWIDGAIERYWATEPETLDPVKRLAVLEESGVAGELLITSPPQMAGADAEMESAIRDAHLRWEIDYCNAVPGRLAGIVDVDYADLDAAIATIRHGREHGLFGGILAPGRESFFRQIRGGADVPGIADPHWEPVWSLCEELDLPVITHGGVASDASVAYPKTDMSTAMGLMVLESPYFSVRNLLLLMAAKVLDRHPRLKLAFIEQQIAFIPGLLHDCDQEMGNYSVQNFRRGLEMLPSEYWARHAFVGASFLDPSSTAMRHDLGIDNLMWGGDYPHPEGSWPNVTDALRYGLGGVPEEELRAILGTNAANVWGFDLELLQGVADRIGPSVELLASPLLEDELPLYATGVTFSPTRRVSGRAPITAAP